MIDLHGSKLTDILPSSFANNTETAALAYAIGNQVAKICAYADNARTYAAIQTMPENVLDALAIELRTPAYSQDFTITVKRALVQGTLLFYMEMGTPAAVNQLICTIFSDGNIEEWFEYEGEPHHFRANITNNAISTANVEDFKTILNTVKRLSSWIDEITQEIYMPEITLFFGVAMGKTYRETRLPEITQPYEFAHTQTVLASAQLIKQVTLPESGEI